MVGKLRALFVILPCLLLIGAWPNTGKKYLTTPAAYSGPGDVVAGAKGWWGLRAYNLTLASAGATTTKVIDVLGSTTATGCTIFLKGDTTGGLDLTTSGAGGVGNQCASGATTFCTVTNTSCTVSKIYDQSGANYCAGSVPCPLAQATAADQPTLQFTGGPGNTLDMLCPGASNSLLRGANDFGSGTAQPFTFALVTIGAAGTNSPTGNNGALFYYDSTTLVGMYAGSASADVTVTNAWHAFGALYNSTSSLIYTDGSASSSLNPGTAALNTQPRMCTDQFSNTSVDKITEFGIWSTGLSGAQISNLSSNAHTFYGF